MSTLTVTAKGQTILRKDILEHLGISPGDKIVVEKLPGSRIEVKAAATGNIADTFGLLKRKGGRSLSVERLKRIAARGWVGKQ